MRIILLMAALLCTRQAAAQNSDKAMADELFKRGLALMQEGNFKAACTRFAASQELDPAPGTLLNLARCNEKLGRLARAWSRYRQAANLAQRMGQNKRTEFANERAARLESRLAQLTIEVPDAVPGLAITRDDEAVERAYLGKAVYVDPGRHKVIAIAPGFKPFIAMVTTEAGKHTVVRIAKLVSRPGAALPGEANTGAQTSTAPGNASNAQVEAPGSAGTVNRERRGSTGTVQRGLGLAAGGIGLAGVALGGYLGWTVKSMWNEPFDLGLCDHDSNMCTVEGQALTDRARSRANLATIVMSAGAGLAVTGIILYVLAPSRLDAGAHIAPMAGAGDMGVVVTGRF